jgi:hypothetical protein
VIKSKVCPTSFFNAIPRPRLNASVRRGKGEGGRERKQRERGERKGRQMKYL